MISQPAEGKSDPFGRDAIRPLDVRFEDGGRLPERVLSESSRDNLSVVAGGCAFYALFAIFPALSALMFADRVLGAIILRDMVGYMCSSRQHYPFLPSWKKAVSVTISAGNPASQKRGVITQAPFWQNPSIKGREK